MSAERRGDPSPLERALVDRIRADGPQPFDQVVERALYDPDHGFYATGGRAGRHGGDFLTSPEVGPLFGAVLARALDQWWVELGRPDPFTVIEAAAGVGTLARAVLEAQPACARALHYVLVERSARLRAEHGQRLASVAAGRIESRADLPPAAVTGVVLANELLDNLAFGLVERTVDGWHPIGVGLADGPRPALVEVRMPAPPRLAAQAQRLAPDAAPGARIPIQDRAAAWLGDALARLDRGRVVVLDYADTTASMARRPADEWMRTYRGQGRGGAALDDLGRQDITCEVALDQLAEVRSPDREEAQAEFLTRHGLDELVAEGRRTWTERAHIGDLAAIQARSRVGESEALTDPSGLGAFRVVQWQVG